jgi:(2Fe-2S) ferredoxin
MSRYLRHIFVCTNKREEGHPKGSCAQKGSELILNELKKGLRERGLKSIVRGNSAGCLDACSFGPSIVIYPEGVWYGGVTKSDVEEIVERHIIQGEIVDRLLIRQDHFNHVTFNLSPLHKLKK